jgi:hypothetical protein
LLLEPLQQRFEAARKVSDLVAGAAARQRRIDLPFRAKRGIGGTGEAPDAHRQIRRVAQKAQRDEHRREQREAQQINERIVRQRQDRVAALLEHDTADEAVGAAYRCDRGDDRARRRATRVPGHATGRHRLAQRRRVEKAWWVLDIGVGRIAAS